MAPPVPRVAVLLLLLAACGDAGAGGDATSSTTAITTADPTQPTSATPTTTGATTTATSLTGDDGPTDGGDSLGVTGSSGGLKFDLPTDQDLGLDTDGPAPSCKVVDDMNAIGDCKMKAPPDSFEPEVQWSWGSAQVEGGSSATPLVANLTDDNGDGAIDLCDIPDIVVVAGGGGGIPGKLYVLDGATGTLHFAAATGIEPWVTPALGDIDGDGIPEIIAATPGGFINPSRVVALEHDGTLKWISDDSFNHDQGGAIALGDLDNDGDVEIVADDLVLDHNGKTIFIAPEQALWDFAYHCTATALADLDGDGDLEVVLGQAAYHHDGTVYYNNPQLKPGFPQIANFDNDPQPEILLTNVNGITVLEHDGTIKFADIRPTGDPPGAWFRPATVHDFDGDDISEFAVSSAAHYTVYEPGAAPLWTANVQDASGWAAGTAFDFDGDGVAEAMYADEATLYVFDGMGVPLLSVPRSSKTLIEYPVVADVDNDGSAEIVVVSDLDFNSVQSSPTVQVIRDKEDRWIQARRIWNQHTYHVTNVVGIV